MQARSEGFESAATSKGAVVVPEVRGGTVFVVESEVNAGSSLTWMLRTAGFSVATFSRGRDFLAALRPEDRGCVLVNLRLSDVDCVAVLEELANRGVSMPVVLYGGKTKLLSVVQPLSSVDGDSGERGFGLAVLGRVTRAMEIDDAMRSNGKRTERARARLAVLTKRELEIAQMVVGGKATKVIASDLGISDRTVEIHRSRVMHKTNCDAIADLVWVFANAGFGESVAVWPIEELRRQVDAARVSAN